jgi:TetR/AcrR family transcriptional repressor of bet genes
LDSLFEVLFSEAWAHPDVLGAWIAFWTLTRTDPAFAEVNAAYNQKLRILIHGALSRLPPASRRLDLDSATKILASVMDGLWLEASLRPTAAGRAEAVALCRATLRRLTAG